MFSNKDYSNLSLDELMAEEKKLRSQTIGAAFFIGMMLGVIFYAVMNHKYLIAIIVLVVTTLVGYKNTKDRKGIQAEINGRKTVD